LESKTTMTNQPKLRVSAVISILSRWLEFSRASRTSNPGGTGGGAWRGESDALMWICTVGSKVERCPRMFVRFLGWVPVVELAAKTRAALAVWNSRIELGDDSKETRANQEDAERRLSGLTCTWQYREGMEYLTREFFKCCALEGDTSFLVYSCVAMEGSKENTNERLLEIMSYLRLKQAEVAEIIGTSRVTVGRYCASMEKMPLERLEQLEDWVESLRARPVEPEANL